MGAAVALETTIGIAMTIDMHQDRPGGQVTRKDAGQQWLGQKIKRMAVIAQTLSVDSGDGEGLQRWVLVLIFSMQSGKYFGCWTLTGGEASRAKNGRESDDPSFSSLTGIFHSNFL